MLKKDTPNKLSLKKNKKRTPLVKEGKHEGASDDEKENDELGDLGAIGSFRKKYRTPRRESTILAGNLAILDKSPLLLDHLPNVSVVKSNQNVEKIRNVSREDSNQRFDDDNKEVVTEDESDFYSCQGSVIKPGHDPQNESWLTEITSKGKINTADDQQEGRFHQFKSPVVRNQHG